jgi:LysM repeat protein
VKGYQVQSGDNLFRIALTYGVGVEALQRANCRSGTVIYPGEWLWVPFFLPPSTELTIIPTFDTPTEEASPTTSATPTDASPTAETQDP